MWSVPYFLLAEETTTTWTYDSNGNLASITDPEGHTTEFLRYDILGNPLEKKDERGFIWHYSYDALSRKLSETDPLKQTSTYEYDGANNMTAIVDVAQNRSEFVYNLHNRLIKGIDSLENENQIVYNSDQLPIQVIDEEGNSRFTEYDNEGRLVRSIDGAGNEVVHHYDKTLASHVSSKVPVRIEYPTYNQRRYYDKLQQLIQATDVVDDNISHSVRYEYDVATNLIAQIDQEGKTTNFEYDALNRLVKTRDALGGVTELSYDDRDNLIALKNANLGVTRFEYDRNDNLLKVIRPMGQVTQYEYDVANNQTAQFSINGQKIAYQYDALSRVKQVDYYVASVHNNPVKTVSFTYDAVGNLKSYDDGITSATYTYDALGRQLNESVNYGQFTLSYSYEYYANGLNKSFTGPDSVKVTYSYDDNNRLSTIDIPNAGRVTYNQYQWNSLAKITLPGGSQIDLTYDPLMRLQSKVVKEPAQNVLMDYRYESSPVGMITNKETEQGEYIYEYDDLYRLTEASNPILEDESYTYDPLANRLTATGVTGGGRYNANNAILNYGEVEFEYDANGNLVKKTLGPQVTHYEYNVEDRLVRVEDGNGNTIASYYYDPFGRRLFKEVEGVRTYFLYADEGLIGEYDEKGVELKGYGYRPNSSWTTNPLFQKTNGSYYWYHNDHLGTPQKLVDSQGNVVWEAVYEAFGEARVEVALVENNLRFPGQYYDAETLLHYNYFRSYDSSLGRYTQFDPLGLAGGSLNAYGYVYQNPIIYTDPTGQFAQVAVGACIANPPLCGAIITAIAIGIGWGASHIPNIDIPKNEPMQTAQSNVGDSGIEEDYGEAAATAKCKNEPPLDRCKWLEKQAEEGKYSKSRIIAQAKKWGCKGSRHFKGGKRR